MKILSLCLLFLPSIPILAQQHDSLSTTGNEQTIIACNEGRQPRFSAGLEYLSDNVYAGRKDAARIPYLSAALGYYHKSGLYAEGALSMLMNNSTRVDAGIFTAGYMFSQGNFEGEISASKFFYNTLSDNVRSEVKGDAHASLTYDFNGIIAATAEGYMNFGSKTDYLTKLALEHSFDLFNDRLNITPTVAANAGTQHYYDNYYNNRHLSPVVNVSKKKKQRQPPAVTADMSNASNFTVLDEELSLPISYTIHKRLSFSFEPTYAIPLHPAVLTLTTLATKESTVKVERLHNQFYWSLGITYEW
ncbi:hypothetical protein FHW36_10229 [Chitinophaga polysaccharea]|uniref:Outer membrane protein with beta-barrel domain n=1 Tax=Chitinophaga polysaccharea TaxID=1293035 RepID=A0A561PVY1_9BACT|nr:hypothetical protein [Chitinophaga polysaccharea]TWF42274.1 hypothetical protein FHW36_10229 [Chitinophaga polysaccharea]